MTITNVSKKRTTQNASKTLIGMKTITIKMNIGTIANQIMVAIANAMKEKIVIAAVAIKEKITTITTIVGENAASFSDAFKKFGG